MVRRILRLGYDNQIASCLDLQLSTPDLLFPLFVSLTGPSNLTDGEGVSCKAKGYTKAADKRTPESLIVNRISLIDLLTWIARIIIALYILIVAVAFLAYLLVSGSWVWPRVVIIVLIVAIIVVVRAIIWLFIAFVHLAYGFIHSLPPNSLIVTVVIVVKGLVWFVGSSFNVCTETKHSDVGLVKEGLLTISVVWIRGDWECTSFFVIVV